ncbi:MAG: hypothetical protein JSU86_03800 [Phycisphaerales bacterium]|nr:MAG: hypothetical protein JSU86_03800 [Phycisphaerales bacterium]
MSILTKVFVVLLVVFSIAFTSMTVAIVAQTTNWRETAEKYREHARVADTNLRHAHAANAAQLATARDEVRAYLERITEIDGQLQDARNEAAQLRAEVAKAASEKSSSEAINRGLLSQLQVVEAARAEYRTQRDDLELRNIELERRSIDLNDRVNELTATTTVLLEQKRQYEQQINILRSQNEKLVQQARRAPGGAAFEHPEGAAMRDVVALTPVARTAIRGKVLEVAANLVTIGVGSADGVKKDMVFVIHRNGEYVGDLKITLVDPNQSAGQIVRSSVAPKAGDDVTDARWLSGSRGGRR